MLSKLYLICPLTSPKISKSCLLTSSAVILPYELTPISKFSLISFPVRPMFAPIFVVILPIGRPIRAMEPMIDPEVESSSSRPVWPKTFRGGRLTIGSGSGQRNWSWNMFTENLEKEVKNALERIMNHRCMAFGSLQVGGSDPHRES